MGTRDLKFTFETHINMRSMHITNYRCAQIPDLILQKSIRVYKNGRYGSSKSVYLYKGKAIKALDVEILASQIDKTE